MMNYLVLLILPMLFGLYAQMRVQSAYSRYSRVGSRGRLTGSFAASAVMRAAGIDDVKIVEVPGQLSDHYDPVNKKLALSSANYHGTSLAALGIAAHEAGHAIQHKVGYNMMKFRQSMVPAMQIASPVAGYVMGFGLFMAFLLGAKAFGILLIQLGVAAFLVISLFQLITLPVEFDASRRAKLELVKLGILEEDEMGGVNETLNAAALTYVAALVASLGQLLYLISMLNGMQRRD